jgi:hypothetical protein
LNNIERIICLPCKYRESEKGLRIDNDRLCQARTTFEKIQAWIQARYHIREMVQVVEMLSQANWFFTEQWLKKQGIDRDPNCDDLATHYITGDGINSSGRELFKKKWPFIWREVISSKNNYYAGLTFGHKPNLFECYEQYIFCGGLESFWDRHKLTEKKDFVVPKEKEETITTIAA